MPYKANEPCRHKIPRARYQVCNWPEYDRALQQRGSLTVWVTPEALAAWHPPHTGGRGRPRDYSDVAIETGHLLRLAFGRPWRQTEGLLRSLGALLGIDVGVPDHTTFSRRSPGLALAASLAQAQTSGPVHVVIDATGLKVYGAGEWLVEKHGKRGTRTWRKLHLAIDPNSGEILASELTSNEEGDASQVGPLLDQIPGPIASVTATQSCGQARSAPRRRSQLLSTPAPAPGCPASPPPQRQAGRASGPRARWCRAGSSAEVCRARRLAAQLRQLIGQAQPGEAPGDARAERLGHVVLGRGGAQDVAHFLLHAAAVPGGTLAQALLHLVVQVAHHELSHCRLRTHHVDSMISDSGRQASAVFHL